jgi:hypothetical protein
MMANIAMQAGVDGIKRLFDSSMFPITLVRNIGLYFADKIGPVKVTISFRM